MGHIKDGKGKKTSRIEYHARHHATSGSHNLLEAMIGKVCVAKLLGQVARRVVPRINRNLA